MRPPVRSRAWAYGVLLVLLTSHSSLVTRRAAWAETADRIVAVVNDDVITEADITAYLRAQLQDGEEGDEGEGTRPPRAVARQRAMLDQLIEHRLILQEAKRAGLSADAGEVASQLEAMRSRFGSQEELQASLAASGLSLEGVREKIREQLLVRRLIDEKVRAGIQVSPQEVARALQEQPELREPGEHVRAAHLLIRVSDVRSEAEARALIEDLDRQIAAGAEFSEIARRYSEDPSREDGGEMGWVQRGELLPELDRALFALKEGERSAPLQTRLGFHLLRTEERQATPPRSTTDAHRLASRRLYQQKFEEAFARWLAELKARAYLQILHGQTVTSGE